MKDGDGSKIIGLNQSHQVLKDADSVLYSILKRVERNCMGIFVEDEELAEQDGIVNRIYQTATSILKCSQTIEDRLKSIEAIEDN